MARTTPLHIRKTGRDRTLTRPSRGRHKLQQPKWQGRSDCASLCTCASTHPDDGWSRSWLVHRLSGYTPPRCMNSIGYPTSEPGAGEGSSDGSGGASTWLSRACSPSHSLVIGSGDRNRGCSNRARAKQRGQCSTSRDTNRARIDRPHREQFRNISASCWLLGCRPLISRFAGANAAASTDPLISSTLPPPLIAMLPQL